MKDVVRAADEYKSKHDRLDVLLNNAGAINMDRETTADGYERTFATNHLGYFVLTDRFARLAQEERAKSRIINVASEAHRQGSNAFPESELRKNGYSGFGAYGTSKLPTFSSPARAREKTRNATGVTAKLAPSRRHRERVRSQ